MKYYFRPQIFLKNKRLTRHNRIDDIPICIEAAKKCFSSTCMV